ncbi:hypothetical protein [Actinoplanes sp. RD1]|uniref:hypothetical protein n=1 Tax=Actinoplanes sp. RD1 TaxID=3064538 RepID=UPI00274186DA|nr:hypothetical protein [Actinoplanes sp. RD1]
MTISTTGRNAVPEDPYTGRTTGRRANAVPAALLEDRRRHLTDYLLPATVILAGVLVVVAGGFVISHLGQDDTSAQLPQPQPPALPDVPLDPPPASQFPIPLESDTPTPTPTTTTPSARPTTTPPSRKERPTPFPGSVSVTRAGIAGLVDLGAEGTRDWVHWGQEGTFSLERKSGGGFAILEGAPTAPRFRHGLSPQRFQWDGGSPVEHSDGTPTGIRTCDKGNGFTLSAPAGTTSRTLKLYVGAVAARGKLTARLSTGGPVGTATFTQSGNNLGTTAYVITYRAPKAGKLNLTWTTDASFDDDCGGVALEAATLR